MLTGENFNSNAPQKSIKALPSHSLYHSPSRSAEDAVLLPEFRVLKNPLLPLLPQIPPKAGVQRTQSFARVRGVPENPLLPLLPQIPPKAGVQRTQSFAGVRGIPENPLFPLLPP